MCMRIRFVLLGIVGGEACGWEEGVRGGSGRRGVRGGSERRVVRGGWIVCVYVSSIYATD